MHLMHRDSHFNCPIYLDAAEFLNSKVLQKVQGYGIGLLKLSKDAVKLGVMMYNIVYLTSITDSSSFKGHLLKN